MRIQDISTPDVYTDSADFRFFLKWIEIALTKIHYDTENGLDLYDPLKCPENLLWMLADTMGFKYDDRLPTSFNRFVLLYFMSMIRNRGSKDGVTLAAEANLKQFDIEMVAGTGYTKNDGTVVKPKDILYNRLEDTSIPVNSVYVTPHTKEGYIDVIYFSDRVPIDACIEYVRPLGMYCFQNAGVRMDARTKITVDARLTNLDDVGISLGPTHVGHYSRTDYARMQRLESSDLIQYSNYDTATIPPKGEKVRKDDLSDERRNAWYRNADYEGYADTPEVQAKFRKFNPGYRALYSLQLCNNEHIVKSLVPSKPGVVYPDPSGKPEEFHDRERIFGLGWEPQDVSYHVPDDYVLPNVDLDRTPGGRLRPWNLRYDKTREESAGPDIYTIDTDRSLNILHARPSVNPVMKVVGDAISLTTTEKIDGEIHEKIDNKRFGVAYNHDGTYPITNSNISKDGNVTANIQNGEIAVGDLHMNDEIPNIHEPEDSILDRDDNIMLDTNDSYIRTGNPQEDGSDE